MELDIVGTSYNFGFFIYIFLDLVYIYAELLQIWTMIVLLLAMT